MKIAFFEVDKHQKAYLREFFPEANYDYGLLTPKEAPNFADIEVLVIRVYTQVTEELLNLLPKLKLLLTMSTGIDHIDLNACKKHGVQACNVTGYSDEAVAEHVFGLLLCLAKNIVSTYNRVKTGQMSDSRIEGYELAGKTLGIVGCGGIGIHAAKIAQGFGMKILVFDIVKNEKWAKKYGFDYVEFDELLAQSDAVTLHVPYNKHTHHLIDKKALAKMKDGAVLINTARGQIVDTEALLTALENKTLSGAGLDVVEDENFIEDKPVNDLQKHLFKMENVIVTPHNAYNSIEALHRRLDTTVKNITSFSEGKELNDKLV
ncbi:hydroxyacid dehydrogenase [Candidatus Woesearchaeota archaeon]|nr:hydroxyacid dehydrogenase [Candidatus Woesearchaeota archaeon]